MEEGIMGIRRFALACLGVVLTLATGLTIGCSRNRLELAAEDSGGQATLRPGQTFTLSLASNPTTGYSWEFVGLDAQDIVEVVKEEYVADSKLIGAGGVQTIVLKTVKAGEVELTLVYHRPWETDVEPIQTFTYKVTVQE
jgi:inhibitor of cysteine peptidase